MRLLTVLLIIACLSTGCTNTKEGTAVASSEPPHDLWQLAERMVNAVPLTIEKMQRLLETPMVDDPQTPGLYEGGPATLGPSLQVPSSSIAIDDVGTWESAGFDVEPKPCVTIDMVKAHYPSVFLKYGVTGHSVYEDFGWVVTYDWGELGFGMRVKDDCLTGIGLSPAKTPKPGQ
jgi:hypothetical protein